MKGPAGDVEAGPALPGGPAAARLLAAAGARYDEYLRRLSTLVGIDSGSRHVEGLHEVAGHVARWCAGAGLDVRRVPVRDGDGVPLGDAVVGRVRGTGRRRVLLAGHLDTVFPPGTAARRPFTVTDGVARGPGVCDDKGGVLAGLAAVRVLRDLGRHAYGELVLLCTPDEEIGSVGSQPLLAELAAGADVGLCLEGARENGDLVSARKGVADVEVVLRGRAAHAGIEPERGANAALAAAHLTVDLQGLNGRWPDVTVNVGVLSAGDRPNVVAGAGRLLVDLRARRVDHFTEAVEQIRRLAARPVVPGVETEVRLHAPAPPWEHTADTARLVEIAQRVGADLGLALGHAATGGCADANLLVAAGLPVLDGLGPVGGGDHGPQEWLDLSSVVPRVALLAGLVDRLCQD
jgi:glutamate carboxypeptidase